MIQIVIYAHRFPQNVRVRSKRPLPEPIADHHIRAEGQCVVARIEGAPQLRAYTQHRKVIRSHPLRRDPRGLGAARKVPGGEKVEGHVLKNPRLLQVLPLGNRNANIVCAHTWKIGLNAHQFAGVRVGQRMEQSCVDDAVDGGGGSDAQRHCGDRNQRESRRSQKHANCVAQVEEHVLEEGEGLLGMMVLADRFRRTQLDGGLAPRFGRRHTGAQILLGLES